MGLYGRQWFINHIYWDFVSFMSISEENCSGIRSLFHPHECVSDTARHSSRITSNLKQRENRRPVFRRLFHGMDQTIRSGFSNRQSDQ
ncbi:MAG: hypothetical protein GY927_22435 [bacterium]|nr:hypothetical protein [bacterium]